MTEEIVNFENKVLRAPTEFFSGKIFFNEIDNRQEGELRFAGKKKNVCLTDMMRSFVDRERSDKKIF